MIAREKNGVRVRKYALIGGILLTSAGISSVFILRKEDLGWLGCIVILLGVLLMDRARRSK